MPLETGTRLGVLEIKGPLGAGGMGEVYRARDTRLDRDVAIKILPAAFALDADRLMRFEREAKTLAALNHPHIAQIYGLADLPGSPGAPSTDAGHALVMELVEGEDLAAAIARGPLPVGDAVAMAAQIAEALEAAHDAGITHRDLKPANIKVRPDGTIKVLDFGLARPAPPGGGTSSGSLEILNSPTMTSPALTMQGVILGTATYMAPEQAKGKPVDRRADIWAFGCVLYEMLTGRRAFHGDDISDTMVSILRDEPRWQALPDDTPPHVRRLLRQCLEKDVRKRLPHIGIARLELGSGDEPMTAATVPPSWRARAVWALTGAAVVALAAVPLWPRITEPATPTIRFTIEPPAGAAFPGAVGAPRFAMAPDGSALVYQVTLPNGTSQLLLRRLDTPVSRPLPGSDGGEGALRGQQPFFSPDGRYLGFFDEPLGALMKMDLQNGELQTLARMEGTQYGGSWGDDDTLLFATNRTDGVQRVPASGGPSTRVTQADPAQEQHLWPEFLPGGRHFLYFTLSGGAGLSGGAVFIASVDGGTPKRLLETPAAARFAGPDRVLFVRGDSLYAQRLDLDRLELTGEPELLANDVHRTSQGRLAVSASRTGVLVYSAGDRVVAGGDALWVDRAGRPIAGQPPIGEVGSVRLSPDGRLLAFDRFSPGTSGARRELWVRELARGIETRLGPLPDFRSLAFTRDGSRIAFPLPDSAGIAWQPVSGGRPPEILVAGQPMQVMLPHDWTPDGELLYSSAQVEPGVHLLPRPGAAGGPARQVMDVPVSGGAAVSPDGRWVVYALGRAGGRQVFLQPFPDGGSARTTLSPGGATQPRWRADGREVYFLQDRTVYAVRVTTAGGLQVGAPERLFEIPGLLAAGTGALYDVTPDGQRFVVLVPRGSPEPARLTVVVQGRH
jgi:eukaryotic-like serine/threonine-protein kinase